VTPAPRPPAIAARLVALALALALPTACQTSGASLQASGAGYRAEDTSVPPSPHGRVRWKAFLLAGDSSIKAFDNAIKDLAVLFEGRGVTVAQRFSSDPAEATGAVALATEANLRRLTLAAKAGAGEGCLLYATSHGTVHGLRLTSDPDSGRFLTPASLRGILAAACGEAPTIVVMSGCHTGTFLREDMVGPDRILLTAAGTYQKSFGCRASRRYTYYDGCFLREFPRAATWQDLYRRVADCIVVNRSGRSRSRPPRPRPSSAAG